MAEFLTRDKYYILLENTTGYYTLEDLRKEQLQPGTILEELEEQPNDDLYTKTFVVADRRDVYFDCDDYADCSVNKFMITDGEAKRLLKIASPKERYKSFRESHRSAEEEYELYELNFELSTSSEVS